MVDLHAGCARTVPCLVHQYMAGFASEMLHEHVLRATAAFAAGAVGRVVRFDFVKDPAACLAACAEEMEEAGVTGAEQPAVRRFHVAQARFGQFLSVREYHPDRSAVLTRCERMVEREVGVPHNTDASGEKSRSNITRSVRKAVQR